MSLRRVGVVAIPAEIPVAMGVKVYPVGVGTDGEAPVPMGGGRYVLQRVELDEPLLREIAELTGGEYFRAVDTEGLAEIYERIDELEKTEIESHVRVLYDERFSDALLPAIGLLLLESLLVTTRLRRVP